jgi:hypothetical protein
VSQKQRILIVISGFLPVSACLVLVLLNGVKAEAFDGNCIGKAGGQYSVGACVKSGDVDNDCSAEMKRVCDSPGVWSGCLESCPIEGL